MADEQDESGYGPNPELYFKLAIRRETRDEAESLLKDFFLALKKLREEHGIPELMVLAAVHHNPEKGSKDSVAVQGLAFGSPDFRPQLGAIAFNTYTLPAIERAEELRELAMATSLRKKGK